MIVCVRVCVRLCVSVYVCVCAVVVEPSLNSGKSVVLFVGLL